MAKPQKQDASALSKTLSGQWSKTEKRAKAARDILQAKLRTHAINKAFKQSQILNK
jgi:hypothetical protein